VWAWEARNGREALTSLRAEGCDVLLLDLSLPDMSGLDVLQQIKAHESVACLVLSAYPEKQYGLNVLRAGASGFVSKAADDAELCRAIRAVVRGGRYVSPELAKTLVSGMQGADAGEPRHSVLSEREFQIFCKLAEGRSVTEIAGRLYLSVKTVSTYRSRILDKMGMKSNADMTYYAVKNDLLQ
jgi:DNA-binding NarL/FixJ family response regulator